MKASELLVLYEDYLSERFKKYSHYLKPATALLRRYKGGRLTTDIENELIQASDSKAHNLSLFLTFVEENGYALKPIENDLEQVRARAYDLIEEYYKGQERVSVYTSPLNQLLKSIEKGEVEKFIHTNPRFNQELALGFLTWITHTKKDGEIGMSSEQLQHWIDELVVLTMSNQKATVPGEIESVLKAFKMLELKYLDWVVIDLVINHEVHVTDLIKFTGKQLMDLGESTNSPAIANFFKHETPLPKRAAFPTLSKKEVEKIVHRAFSAIGKPDMSLSDWRKLRASVVEISVGENNA